MNIRTFVLHNYYCNLFHCDKRSSIELTFNPDDSSGNVVISVERNPDGSKNVTSPSGHADPHGFLKEISSELVFLDNKIFQKFIEDSPLDRGRSFAKLLGSSQLSEFRHLLNTLSNSGNINTDFQLNVFEIRLDGLAGSKRAILNRIVQSYKSITGSPPNDATDHQAIKQGVTKILNNVELLKPFLKVKDITTADYVEIRKTINSAIANAENNFQYDIDNLYIKEAYCGKSIVMKRFRPRAKGRASPIKKPYSNVTIILSEKKKETEKHGAKS